ncbi:MAG: hypothetical protein MUF48_17490 [Pirellulaceae bacterium]|nr:hypothetical protein [Pirellulaceae bacterium]
MRRRWSFQEKRSGRPVARRAGPFFSPPRSGQVLVTLLVILITVSLVVVPVLLAEWPHELSRWCRAAAAEADLDGDYAQAVAHMDRAIHWDGTDPQLYLQRALYHLETKQWELGLADCDRARERNGDPVAIAELRAQLLQHLGRHQEAVAQWREIVFGGGDVLPERRAQHLNGLAYAQAVANLDLDQALVAVEESLRLTANAAAMYDPAGVISFGRAVTARDLEDLATALSSLNDAAESAAAALEATTQRIAAAPRQDLRGALAQATEMQSMRAHLAGILRQRVGVNEALGHSEAAQQDEQRLAELSTGGQLVAAAPYPLSAAIERVNRVASVLDTRGFVLYRIGQLDAALEDLTRASQAGEWLSHAMDWILDETKHRVTDVRLILQRKHQDARTRAVIAYHRMLVLQALGRAEEAERDAQLVRDLGYEPGEALF